MTAKKLHNREINRPYYRKYERVSLTTCDNWRTPMTGYPVLFMPMCQALIRQLRSVTPMLELGQSRLSKVPLSSGRQGSDHPPDRW
ncbi:hypothetical protein SAICODRAFT_10254 [Saitoella complicata NRRL Y-17804]|uniref:uncharacterized protein n=1 Tax=Saitoella complicata (strain BCRC 22490 / CBS 7301 / JCM 7358 / NBRC 10748 / NRRL Y-17804) TaxID=698492 RepID=UPI000866EEFD|nr:uncharacterized protein SAICODRAFT_10254 [Saitoella complicata NRRL Y-17804]ODQ49959.1 hypothetical protein SAICODRAFT_10254 [Saitoella complicata NRRL Y-17804]